MYMLLKTVLSLYLQDLILLNIFRNSLPQLYAMFASPNIGLPLAHQAYILIFGFLTLERYIICHLILNLLCAYTLHHMYLS